MFQLTPEIVTIYASCGYMMWQADTQTFNLTELLLVFLPVSFYLTSTDIRKEFAEQVFKSLYVDDYVGGNDLDDSVFDRTRIWRRLSAMEASTCERRCPTPQSYKNELKKMKDSLSKRIKYKATHWFKTKIKHFQVRYSSQQGILAHQNWRFWG